MKYILCALLILAALLVLLIGIWLCSMRRNMPWQNCLAILPNLKIPLPKALRDYARSGERDYSTLPDPLTMADGSPVVTPEQFDRRRQEILSLLRQHVYGTLPETGFDTAFETLEEGDALDGAALRRQIKITVTTPKGSSDALLLLYTPKQGAKAAVIGLNFRGNHTVLADPVILPSFSFDTSQKGWEEKRGSAAGRWCIQEAIARGYAIATICSADLAPDSKQTYASRVISLFDEPEFKAIGAWAFGLMRGADYLVRENVPAGCPIAVIGHSRLGKAALWAGANDRRFGLVISNDSGNSGASLSRGNHGETVYTINMAFPHWFASGYARYGKNENTLPVDQNLLLAAIAPRKLYVASAVDDLWSDPQGAFNALMAAKSAFSLHGCHVLPARFPDLDGHSFCPSMGTHIRSGGHDITPEDWKYYFAFMDEYFTE